MNGIKEKGKRDLILNPQQFSPDRKEQKRPTLNIDECADQDLAITLISSRRDYDLSWTNELGRVYQGGFSSEATAHKSRTSSEYFLDTQIQLTDREIVTLSAVDDKLIYLETGTVVDLITEREDLTDFEGTYRVLENEESNAGKPDFEDENGRLSKNRMGRLHELLLVEVDE